MSDFNEDILKKQVIEKWTQGGSNWPVKVMPANHPDANSDSVSGYFTQEKYVSGRSPQELEKILGFPEGHLKDGFVIKPFDRLPTADEFNLRSYTNRPDGAAPIPGNPYQPGLGAPQWQIKEKPIDESPILIPAHVTVRQPGYEMIQPDAQNQLDQQSTDDHVTSTQQNLQPQASSATAVPPTTNISTNSSSDAYANRASSSVGDVRTYPGTSSTNDRINELLAGGNVRSSERVEPISPVRPLSGDEGSPDWGQQPDNHEQSPNQNPPRQPRPGDQDEFEPRDPEEHPEQPGQGMNEQSNPEKPGLLKIVPEPETEPGVPTFDPNEPTQDLSPSTLQDNVAAQDQASAQATQDQANAQATQDQANAAAQDQANAQATQDQANSTAQDQANAQPTQDQANAAAQDQASAQATQDQANAAAQDQANAQATQDQANSTAQDQANAQPTQDQANAQPAQDQANAQATQDQANSAAQDQANSAAQQQQVDSNLNEESALNSSSSENTTSSQVDSNLNEESALSQESTTSDATSDSANSTASVSSQPDLNENVSSSAQQESFND